MDDSFFSSLSLTASNKANAAKRREREREPNTELMIGVVAIFFAMLIYHSWIRACLLVSLSLSCDSYAYHLLGVYNVGKNERKRDKTEAIWVERERDSSLSSSGTTRRKVSL
jgi:hypothetical protein